MKIMLRVVRFCALTVEISISMSIKILPSIDVSIKSEVWSRLKNQDHSGLQHEEEKKGEIVDMILSLCLCCRLRSYAVGVRLYISDYMSKN